MGLKTYLSVSALIFALVTLLHLARIVAGWDLVVGDWTAPVWASVLGILVPGYLAVAASRLARSA